MITHKSLSFILTNCSRIIYPLIKMISKDESIRFEERISITKKEKRKTSYIPQSRGKSKGWIEELFKELGLFLFPEKLS